MKLKRNKLPEIDEDSQIRTYVSATPINIAGINNKLFRIYIMDRLFCLHIENMSYYLEYNRYKDNEGMLSDLLLYGGYLLKELVEGDKYASSSWIEILKLRKLKDNEIPIELRDRVMVEYL